MQSFRVYMVLTVFSCSTLNCVPKFDITPQRRFTIMLDPAGDAKYAGRQIDDCFERGLTLQCCQQIKKGVEARFPIRVILTRIPGETLEPLQNANFANRLDIDCYVSLHFYYAPDEQPTLTLYHFHCNRITDYWASQTEELRFIRHDEAHKASLPATKKYGNTIKETVKNLIHASCAVQGLFGMPFKPLIGICAPALGIEIGLRSRTDWHYFVGPLVESLGRLVT